MFLISLISLYNLIIAQTRECNGSGYWPVHVAAESVGPGGLVLVAFFLIVAGGAGVVVTDWVKPEWQYAPMFRVFICWGLLDALLLVLAVFGFRFSLSLFAPALSFSMTSVRALI